MSAVIISLKGTTAHILTDGATYDPGGALNLTLQKVFPIASLDLVLAVRGWTFIGPTIAGVLNEQHDTFDEAVEKFPDSFARMLSLQPETHRHHMRDPLEAYLVGISQARGRAEAWVYVNSDIYGLPVGEMIQLPEGLAIPGDVPFLEILPARGLDPCSPGFDPARDGLRLMRELRDRPWPLGRDGKLIYGVGGFCQLTSVYRDRIETRILERWSDFSAYLREASAG